jgi:hypothetical protein
MSFADRGGPRNPAAGDGRNPKVPSARERRRRVSACGQEFFFDARKPGPPPSRRPSASSLRPSRPSWPVSGGAPGTPTTGLEPGRGRGNTSSRACGAPRAAQPAVPRHLAEHCADVDLAVHGERAESPSRGGANACEHECSVVGRGWPADIANSVLGARRWCSSTRAGSGGTGVRTWATPESRDREPAHHVSAHHGGSPRT